MEIARWITIGYGTLAVLALIGLGLLEVLDHEGLFNVYQAEIRSRCR